MINIEEEVFARAKLEVTKLVPYGFIKENDDYYYIQTFMDNSFKAIITITKEGKVLGKIQDLMMNEEYTNFRIKKVGEYANKVRENYREILEDILKHCFIKQYFISKQANRIAELMIAKYHDIPEFVWDSNPGSGIFRNPENRKWYALLMDINKSKLDGEDKLVEVINVKLDDEKIIQLLNRNGFYKAYHMNKKKWITILLDDTLADEEIMGYIEESHQYTMKVKRQRIG